MAAVITNFDAVIGRIVADMEKLTDKDYLLRPLAIETIPLMKERIHIEGAASDGSQIGTYSNGYMKQREAAGRGQSKKVIVALTSQLEQDWAAIATNEGYGIGFNNVFNAEKMRWVEEIKGKKIANLSADEKKYISERLQELIDAAFNS